MAVPPPSPLASTKTGLRRELRARRARFADTLPDRATAEAAIHDRLRSLLDSWIGPFGGYAPYGGEPDILPFLFKAFRHGHDIALPHIDQATAMSFSRWHPEAVLDVLANGLPQPPDAGTVEPRVLLVPLVGFTRSGDRLGQGGGYYDRWFAAHPDARRIGIAWSVQEVASLPTEPWDMPLHAIATEKEWIWP